MAHNRLERLDEGFLAPNLRTTIECLWVSNNNMQELPALFNGVEKLTDIHIDYNPMRSPPVELLSEGMNVIIQVGATDGFSVEALASPSARSLPPRVLFHHPPLSIAGSARSGYTR